MGLKSVLQKLFKPASESGNDPFTFDGAHVLAMAGQDNRALAMTEDLRKGVRNDFRGNPGYIFYGEEGNLYSLREDNSEAIQLAPADADFLQPHTQSIVLKGAHVFCFQEWDGTELLLHFPEMQFKGLN